VNKLSKTQQERLMLVGIGTLALMVALYCMMVVPNQTALLKMNKNIVQKQDKLAKAGAVLKTASDVGFNYTNKLQKLQEREAGLAPDRGAYEWVINTINPFIQNRKGVNIITFSEPTISAQGLLPKFPYRWATFHINAVGYYQDFGRFFADFENTFPYFRIQNLDISENTGPASEPEKLAFNFDIVTPVVPTSTENK
jgi:hypothetical protein